MFLIGLPAEVTNVVHCLWLLTPQRAMMILEHAFLTGGLAAS